MIRFGRRQITTYSSILCIGLAAGLLLAVGESSAQVSAYQGEAKKNPVQEFESPMVLEVPLQELADLPTGKPKNIGSKLRYFVCEDTSVQALVFTRGRNKKRKGHRETPLDLEGFLYVRPSFDRLANVELSVIKGDVVIAHDVQYRIDAEEGKRSRFKTSFKFPAEEFQAIFGEEPYPKLKIVLSVIDND